MVYSPQPPFEILSNRDMDFRLLQRLRHFARYWDLVGNSGNFTGKPGPHLVRRSQKPFYSFLEFSDWLFERSNRRHGIALTQLAEFVFEFLTDKVGLSIETVAEPLLRDYQRSGRADILKFLREHVAKTSKVSSTNTSMLRFKRQARHQTA